MIRNNKIGTSPSVKAVIDLKTEYNIVHFREKCNKLLEKETFLQRKMSYEHKFTKINK